MYYIKVVLKNPFFHLHSQSSNIIYSILSLSFRNGGVTAMTPPVVRLTQALMSCWVCFSGRKMMGVRDRVNDDVGQQIIK